MTRVETCSGTENKGIDKVWDILNEFKKHSINNGWIQENRTKQNVFWFHQKLNQFIKNDFYLEKGLLKNYKK